MANLDQKILLLGGAGLVGQNLAARLLARGYTNVNVLDKHIANLSILKKVQPNTNCIYADLSKEGDWQKHFNNSSVAIMLQAQIGGNNYEDFISNNIVSTKLILECIEKHKVSRVIHISSSVVKSSSDDFYTNSKKEQEKLVIQSGIPCHILRPTLMFGWFDRKHLGWLSRFMKKFPIFPIPGNGKYVRQPLYVGDFCNLIIKCIDSDIDSGIYNISGHEKINYIEIIKKIKSTIRSRSLIIKIPYKLFYILLHIWGVFDKNPPFTTQQLKALTAHDEFEIIDWPKIFNIEHTPFQKALEETFNHPYYSKIILDF